MKRITLRKAKRRRFQAVACLVLVLLGKAAAQQDVDPEHFDKSASTRQVRPAVSRRKNHKSARKRQPQKLVTASVKSDSQQVGQTSRGGQPVR